MWSAGHSRDSELYEVFRDGRREPLAIRADVHAGIVMRYRTDKTGEILRDAATGRPIIQTLYGMIEIRKCNIAPWVG